MEMRHTHPLFTAKRQRFVAVNDVAPLILWRIERHIIHCRYYSWIIFLMTRATDIYHIKLCVVYGVNSVRVS